MPRKPRTRASVKSLTFVVVTLLIASWLLPLHAPPPPSQQQQQGAHRWRNANINLECGTTAHFFTHSFNPSRRCAQRPEDLHAGARAAVPAFVIMVVNRGDWLKRLVYSLDEPIEKLIIVHNILPGGPDYSDVFLAIDELVAEFGSHHVQALTSHKNLGVSRSLNMLFRAFPERYWVVADADFAYRPGQFRRFVDAIDPPPAPPPPPPDTTATTTTTTTGAGTGGIDTSTSDAAMTMDAAMGTTTDTTTGTATGTARGTPHRVAMAPDVVMAPQFRNWALRSSLVEKIGYFDENFWPAYVEDCDYHVRMLLHGNVSLVEMSVAHMHGRGRGVYIHSWRYISKIVSKC